MTALAHQPHRSPGPWLDARDQLTAVAATCRCGPWTTPRPPSPDDVPLEAQLADSRPAPGPRRPHRPAGEAGATSPANWLAVHPHHRQAHRACGSPPVRHPRPHPGRAGRRPCARRAGPGHPPRPRRAARDLDPEPVTGRGAVDQAAHFDAKPADPRPPDPRRHRPRVAEPTKPPLEREERDAAAAPGSTMSDDGHGKVHGRFTLDTLTGAMLKKALRSPPPTPGREGTARGTPPTPERLGRAFADSSSATPPEVPQGRRVDATIVVLMDLDTLMAGVESGPLDTGTPVSAGAGPPPGLRGPDDSNRPQPQRGSSTSAAHVASTTRPAPHQNHIYCA